MEWRTNYGRTQITGFASSAQNLQKDEEKELQTLEEAQEFIQREIKSCDTFERDIKKEFLDIRDMQNNLNAILKRFDSIIKLVRAKEKIVKSIVEEASKPAVDIDVEKCNNYYGGVEKINSELNPMMEAVSRELSKFILPEYHKIYDQSEDLRNQIKKISGDAGKIHAELKYFWSTMNNANTELASIRERLIALIAERAKRPAAHDPIGFNR